MEKQRITYSLVMTMIEIVALKWHPQCQAVSRDKAGAPGFEDPPFA